MSKLIDSVKIDFRFFCGFFRFLYNTSSNLRNLENSIPFKNCNYIKEISKSFQKLVKIRNCMTQRFYQILKLIFE